MTTATISPWLNDRYTIDITAASPHDALSAALSTVLTAFRNETSESTADTSTALAFRGEGRDLSELLRYLIDALFRDVEHDSYDVQAVQFNSYVRTDTGFSGWGYALANDGGVDRPEIAIEQANVTTSLSESTVRISLTRTS